MRRKFSFPFYPNDQQAAKLEMYNMAFNFAYDYAFGMCDDRRKEGKPSPCLVTIKKKLWAENIKIIDATPTPVLHYATLIALLRSRRCDLLAERGRSYQLKRRTHKTAVRITIIHEFALRYGNLGLLDLGWIHAKAYGPDQEFAQSLTIRKIGDEWLGTLEYPDEPYGYFRYTRTFW